MSELNTIAVLLSDTSFNVNCIQKIIIIIEDKFSTNLLF